MNALLFLASRTPLPVAEVSTTTLLVSGGLMTLIAVVRLMRRKDR
jgi:hypothetical protein